MQQTEIIMTSLGNGYWLSVSELIYQNDGGEATQSRYDVTARRWWLQVPQSVNNIITMEISILITFWILSMPLLMRQRVRLNLNRFFV